MYDFLERDIDCKRFDELMHSTRQGKSIAFVGAGMSRPLGYRIWDEGIIESESKEPTLIQLAGIPKDLAIQKPLIKVVDDCRDILKEKYNEFIIKEFGNVNKDKYHLNLILLWKSNFKHIITTNFDSSLFDNWEECNDMLTYANDKLQLRSNRTLYHIHGRVFIRPKEDQDIQQHLIKNIIYGLKSYTEAYDDEKGNGAIENFLYNVVSNYSILFVGFSMKDEDFKRTLEKINKRQTRYLSILNQRPKIENAEDIKHYIFLAYPRRNDNEKEDVYEKEKEKFEYNEDKLSNNNIYVISYKKESQETHKGITKILGHIKENALYRSEVAIGIGERNTNSANLPERYE